ncbi:MAG TPA: hypothetical protein VNA20_10240 [Frankiaceae bacterium]|nr:hypothetical protein [Frankiaceae bacterium]
MSDADDVLAHSEDPDEWEDEPVAIERRPSGNQVLSARIPTALADRVFAEAARRNVKASEIVRVAVESYFSPPVFAVVKVQVGPRVRMFLTTAAYDTENPVVTVGDIPPLRAAM